jgi:hypothetical protein
MVGVFLLKATFDTITCGGGVAARTCYSVFDHADVANVAPSSVTLCGLG